MAAAAYPLQLLDDFRSIVRRRPPNSLADTALRTRSLAIRHLLVHTAGRGFGSVTELLAAGRRKGGDQTSEWLKKCLDPRALADLARVVALQEILPDDKSDGLELYNLALRLFGARHIPAFQQGLHVQLAFSLGRVSDALALLRIYPSVPERVRTDLLLDLANPFIKSAAQRDAGWLASFQRLFPEPYPFIRDVGELAPFDRVTAIVDRKAAGPDKVSVVVTAFKPDIGLVTAVRSLIDQSWENLEILVIDDASPAEFDSILRQCRDLDERVTLIKLNANAGTYAARNVGLDAASGRFVTFQDSDDWSHPRRIEAQIQPLLDDPSLVATISDGVRVSENLVITKPGRNPRIMNTSSLMFRKDAVLSRVGYFDRVRKAADSEYLKRIEAVYGDDAVRCLRGEIYALIRLSPHSLSRAEIRAGWMDPARVAYRSAYELWHKKIKDGRTSPYVAKDQVRRAFPAPDRLNAAASVSPRPCIYDIVILADWRWLSTAQRCLLGEIPTLTRHGMRVAVMHMESLQMMTPHRKPLCQPIQELINDGTVDLVLQTENVDVALVLVADPSILQFPSVAPGEMRAARVVIFANTAPYGRNNGDHLYSSHLCAGTANRLFGAAPLWCPRDQGIREVLEAELTPSDLTPFDLPPVVDLTALNLSRTGFRSDRPVVGRYAKDHRITWPVDRESLLHVYPDTSDVDIRIVGGAKAALALLDTTAPPASWLTYDDDEVTVKSFMFQIDFYAYFPQADAIDELGNPVLHALASGCVVLLPHHFSKTYEDAALYRDPHEVQRTIRQYYADTGLFLDQSKRAQEWVRQNCNPRPYVDLITALIDSRVAGSPTNGTAMRPPSACA